MKILVIFTGGTIGSKAEGKWIKTDSDMTYRLLSHYISNQKGELRCDFDTTEPYSILSENLAACNVNALINCVISHKDEDYDGIIVTHGTDTLQYSAAALSFAIGRNAPPTVFVSSNYPLDDDRSNGDLNFEAAVAFIASGAEHGVFAGYSNDGRQVTIHSANRLLLHAEMKDSLHSVLGNVVARYIDGTLTLSDSYKAGEYADAPMGSITLSECSDILVVSCYPGDRFSYDLSGVKAVLLRPYHSGTLNTDSPYLADFCRRAKEAGVPLLLTGVYSAVSYESSKLFDDLGIVTLPLSAFPVMYMKLWIALSLGKPAVDFMLTPIAGEFLERTR